MHKSLSNFVSTKDTDKKVCSHICAIVPTFLSFSFLSYSPMSLFPPSLRSHPVQHPMAESGEAKKQRVPIRPLPDHRVPAFDVIACPESPPPWIGWLAPWSPGHNASSVYKLSNNIKKIGWTIRPFPHDRRHMPNVEFSTPLAVFYCKKKSTQKKAGVAECIVQNVHCSKWKIPKNWAQRFRFWNKTRKKKPETRRIAWESKTSGEMNIRFNFQEVSTYPQTVFILTSLASFVMLVPACVFFSG